MAIPHAIDIFIFRVLLSELSVSWIYSVRIPVNAVLSVCPAILCNPKHLFLSISISGMSLKKGDTQTFADYMRGPVSSCSSFKTSLNTCPPFSLSPAAVSALCRLDWAFLVGA